MSVDSRLIYLLGRCARLNPKLDTFKRTDLDVVVDRVLEVDVDVLGDWSQGS